MLRRRPKKLICTELTTLTSTATQRYPVPSKTRTTISAATACNKSASAQTLSVSADVGGGVVVRLLWLRTIPAYTSIPLAQLIGQTLEAGSTLYADVSANSSIDLTVSGYEESDA